MDVHFNSLKIFGMNSLSSVSLFFDLFFSEIYGVEYWNSCIFNFLFFSSFINFSYLHVYPISWPSKIAFKISFVHDDWASLFLAALEVVLLSSFTSGNLFLIFQVCAASNKTFIIENVHLIPIIHRLNHHIRLNQNHTHFLFVI